MKRWSYAVCVSFAIMSVLQPVYFHQHGQDRDENYNLREVSTKILPNVILRKYAEWSKFPENVTTLYHSIPVEVTHMKDDLFQFRAPYRQTKRKILNVRLWLEFPDIKRSKELQDSEFIMEITPVIGSRDMNKYSDFCSIALLVSRSRFPDGILEMKFDITTQYLACQAIDVQPQFHYKVLFYPLNNIIDINLKKDKADIFIIFKERNEIEDIREALSIDNNQLHYENIMRTVRHKRSLRQPRRIAKPCSLRPFTFDFDEWSWNDYVIYPKSYTPNKCHGRCTFPLGGNLNCTNYAIIKAVASLMYKNVKSPDCIPLRLDPLAMILKDEEGKITLVTKMNMTAKSCQCA